MEPSIPAVFINPERRTTLRSTGLQAFSPGGLLLPVFAGLLLLCLPVRLLEAGEGAPRGTIEADLLVVGGTESGCAAAIQAARMGVGSIVLVTDADWLGGQFSNQALGAIDENTHKTGVRHEQPIPRHGLFKETVSRIEALNREKYGVARPGNTRVITTVRPADAAQVFEEMVQPYVESGQLRILRRCYPVDATLGDDDRTLEAVRFRSTQNEAEQFTVHAKLTIDASDWGDAIKAAGAAYEFGPDLKSKYGEPEAPTSREKYPVTDMNPLTYCMVLVETDTYAPIEKPPHYDERNYTDHKWPKDPLWLYRSRRLIDRYHFPEVDHPDVVLLCFPAFDYPLDRLPQRVVEALEATEPGASEKNIVRMTRRQRQIVFEDARQYSLGFLYYLQTAVHERMEDTTHSFRRFKLCGEFDTPDRMPPKPYIREALRLKAMHMMRQQDVLGWRNNSANYARVMYPDSVAVWQFEFDFHPTHREFLDDGDPAGPWRCVHRPLRDWGPPFTGRATFPLRSLVPERIDGLLGAQHNLGFSSIVSSAVRLHDHTMAVGQAAGASAAVALRHDVQPRAIPFDAALLADAQEGLCARHDGGEPAMLWPFRNLPTDHPAFEAANLLAVRDGLPLGPTDVAFRPDDPAQPDWRRKVVEQALAKKTVRNPPEPPAGTMTRGEFAIKWWRRIKNLPEKSFPRRQPADADADGTPDVEDPLPFEAAPTSWPDARLPAHRDGLPDPLPDNLEQVRLINFAGKNAPAAEGCTRDTGLPFDPERGFGWGRDISSHHRRRGQLPEPARDTFLFTRGYDRWDYAIEDGTYRVTVCVGDAGFEQADQRVAVEGTVLVDDVTTAVGEFREKSAVVEVSDGRLTVELGRKGRKRNTCLNWLRIARTPANPAE